ncbi:hypothetical protein [Streptomyces sp. NPDC048438]|uniref:hypothetical protein n=1 Tax=Streptomyces sp. NPDC048438 TaxID=3365551 RepID=UPI0037195F5F
MTELQPVLAEALLALVPGAQADTTRVTVEHRYTQLDVQSVDSWSGAADGLACRLAEHLRTAVPEKNTEAPPAEAAFTPATVLVAIARALREQPTGAQLLEGLDELGELSVCDGEPAEIDSWVAALCHLVHLDDVPAAPAVVYRVEHDTFVFGLYTTPGAARQHCEALVSREYPDDVVLTFDWLTDEEDGDLAVAALVVQIANGNEIVTGYTVTPLEAAAEFDPDADE